MEAAWEQVGDVLEANRRIGWRSSRKSRDLAQPHLRTVVASRRDTCSP